MKAPTEEIDVREIIGAALLSGNLKEPPLGRIGAVHRVAAMAKAPRLGSAAWRFKFAHDAKEYHEIVWKLAKRASRELKLPLWRRKGKKVEVHRTLIRASAQAVKEWVINSCDRCGGSGRTIKEGRLVVVCAKCGGDGSKGWTSSQRAAALGLDVEVFSKIWEERLEAIGGILRGVDLDTEAAVKKQLGMRRRRAAR